MLSVSLERLRSLRGYALGPGYAAGLRYLDGRRRLAELEASVGQETRRLAASLPELEDAASRLSAVRAELASVDSEVASVSRVLEDAVASRARVDVLVDFYKAVMDSLAVDELSVLSGALTSVYRGCFGDASKSVVLSMGEFRKKKVVRLAVRNTYGGREYDEDLTDNGGSVSFVLGVVLSVWYIVQTGLPRFVYFDESVSSLSTDVLGAFMGVLRDFSSRLGFAFVIIEHAYYRLRDYADAVYTIRDGKYVLLSRRELDGFFEAGRG